MLFPSCVVVGVLGVPSWVGVALCLARSLSLYGAFVCLNGVLTVLGTVMVVCAWGFDRLWVVSFGLCLFGVSWGFYMVVWLLCPSSVGYVG